MTPTIIVVLLSSLLILQDDSLIASARRNGGVATIRIDGNTPVGTMDALLAESTLIVSGVVRAVTARLSGDGRIVMTAFEVEARHIYRDGRPDIQRRPVTGPLLVERPGGTLLVDGLRLRTDVSGYEDDETPSTGDVVVMFLTAGPGDAWRLTRGPFGMFRVENTRLLQTREAAARRPDAPSDLAGLERWLGNAIK